ncbi:MAG: hypothetical protein ACI83O_000320 [Patescibacteria group bacterium]|jgi:hypothetical protein
MQQNYHTFVISFFKKLNATIQEDNNSYIITNIPRTFLDLLKKPEPLKVNFSKETLQNYENVSNTSPVGLAIKKFVDNAGKTTLLSIEFTNNIQEEALKKISLKNCEVQNLKQRITSNFFSRITFLTTFNFLNKKEQKVIEVYVHQGKILKGNLLGYKIIDGEKAPLNSDVLKNDIQIAKIELQERLKPITEEISQEVKEELDEDVQSVENHYEKQLEELATDLTEQLGRIKKTEIEMRSSEGEEKEELKIKLERLKKGLLKLSQDDIQDDILKEQEFTIRDINHKYSLDINNKILNVTAIYYPLFHLSAYLKNDNAKRIIDLIYDPLKEDFLKLNCDTCQSRINEINLCTNGHIICSNCKKKCNECMQLYCINCLKRTCSSCAKELCKSCIKVCHGCGKTVCKTHHRLDCVSGEERCIACLRACSRCHELAQEKHFSISKDKSKVCQKCIGIENQDAILKKIFD